MDDNKRAEAIWAYTITQERIMERLVRKGSFTQEKADRILEILAGNLTEESIEEYSNSPGCKRVVKELLCPPPSGEDYISSLTELARLENSENPSYVIQAWFRNRNTLEFLRRWELENNPRFNKTECQNLIVQMQTSSFTPTAKKWITTTNAVGIISKQGNTGGTLAHRDIALDFQMWLNPEVRYELNKTHQSAPK